jgi:hypothetical protein
LHPRKGPPLAWPVPVKPKASFEQRRSFSIALALVE